MPSTPGISGPDLQRRFFHQLPGGLQAFGLFDFLPNVSFFAKNAAGQFVKANPRFVRDHGCKTEADLLGKTDRDFHTSEMAQRYIDEDHRVLASGKSLPDQIWLVPDSRRVLHWFVSTKMPLHDHRGRVIGLAGAMRDAESAGSMLSPYDSMTVVLDHVMTHFGERLRITDLAAMLALSVSQFERRFASLFGMTPTAYILRVRLNEAARLLEQTSNRISDIAAACGFYDQSSFTRMFRREYRRTPTDYRKGNGATKKRRGR